MLSIMLTGGTLGKKNSKFKGKYLRNENVNVAHPIKRHAENGWRQKQYGELGSEIKNWELLPASWMSGLHSLWGRCFLVHIQIDHCGNRGKTEAKVSWARKDGSNSSACALFRVIIGNRMLLNAVATEIKREIEIKGFLESVSHHWLFKATTTSF